MNEKVHKEPMEVKRKPIKCPVCGFRPVGTIMYGLPAMDDELKKEIEEGKTIIGGCCIIIGESPEWGCKNCGTRFKKEGNNEI